MFCTANFYSPNAGMSSLNNNPGAVISVYIYCILWFIVQDIVKNGTYYLLDKYGKSKHQAIVEGHAAAHAPSALPDSSHPLQGVDEVVKRAQRNGPIKAAMLHVTPGGTYHVPKSSGGGSKRWATSWCSCSTPSAWGMAHKDHVHAVTLPNGTDLTAVVQHTKGVVGAGGPGAVAV